MSRLARRLAAPTLALLVVQFVGAAVLQRLFGDHFRVALVGHVYRGLEGSGLLADCEARPGPWRAPGEGGWSVWPVAPDGAVVGEGAPVARVTLPAAEAIHTDRLDGVTVDVYASRSAGCGGVVHVLEGPTPVVAEQPATVAAFGIARSLLAVGVGVALVGLTAGPLVRRVRRLSRAMDAVVKDGFRDDIASPEDDEIGDVARAFDAAAAQVRRRLGELEHRDAVLRRALADFAHDLRTPLTTLQLSSARLPDDAASARVRGELAYLEGLTRNLEAILADGDGAADAVVVLDDLVEAVRLRFAPLARDRGLDLAVALPDRPVATQGDAVALERALGNLVHNAVRHADGHVAVLLFREGDAARLEVRDDGPGFDLDLSRAADRGVRGEAAGFGLGLAITEAVARRHGGRLELRNAEEGALAALTLPAVDAGAAGG